MYAPRESQGRTTPNGAQASECTRVGYPVNMISMTQDWYLSNLIRTVSDPYRSLHTVWPI